MRNIVLILKKYAPGIPQVFESERDGATRFSTSTPAANLPSVSLIPVVHLDMRISPRIFEKNVPNVIFRGLGGDAL